MGFTEITLNIDYHIRRATVRALNIARTKRDAAILLGVTERTIFNFLDKYDISYINGVYK
jgi:hypothetical protein